MITAPTNISNVFQLLFRAHCVASFFFVLINFARDLCAAYELKIFNFVFPFSTAAQKTKKNKKQ